MTKTAAITFLISISCFFVANGQIQKGSILLGGQVYANDIDINYSGSSQPTKFHQTFILVSAGKALKENSVYGFNIVYAPVTTANNSNQLGFGN